MRQPLLYCAVVDAVFAEWRFAQLGALQIVAYSLCTVGFALNTLPSNWSGQALAALGVRSRDNARAMTSLYQRARRATSAHLPWRHRRTQPAVCLDLTSRPDSCRVFCCSDSQQLCGSLPLCDTSQSVAIAMRLILTCRMVLAFGWSLWDIIQVKCVLSWGLVNFVAIHL